jgi:hypothetical protein
VRHGLDILGKGFVAPGVVAAPEHDAATHHLEVETSASRRAVVEDQAGMTTGQFVEKIVETVDVTDLAQTHLIRLLVGVPEIRGIEIGTNKGVRSLCLVSCVLEGVRLVVRSIRDRSGEQWTQPMFRFQMDFHV